MRAWKLLSSKLKDLQKDLVALEIDMEGTGIKVALSGLERAVYGSLAKKAGVEQGSGKAQAAPQAQQQAAPPELAIAAEGRRRVRTKKRK
jgi:hypothetical protein